jgi:enoyl-CoA hydratase
VGPDRALALGLVDELTAPDDLLPQAVALAGDLAARSPEAYRMAKQRLHRPAVDAIESAPPSEDAAVLAGWTSEETRRRIEATLATLSGRRG